MSTQEIRQRAVSAFARREKLSKSQRLEFAKTFSGKLMTRRTAWSVAKAYALGEVDEVGKQLERLVCSWLVLGNRRFEIIFKVVRIIHAAVSAGLDALDDLARQLKGILPTISRRRQLFREIKVVKLQFSGVLAFPA